MRVWVAVLSTAALLLVGCGQAERATEGPPERTEPETGGTTATKAADAAGDPYGMRALANCQLAEAQASMTPEQLRAFQYELAAEMVAAVEQEIDTNMQTMLLERGYTCDGTAEEVIERHDAAGR